MDMLFALQSYVQKRKKQYSYRVTNQSHYTPLILFLGTYLVLFIQGCLYQTDFMLTKNDENSHLLRPYCLPRTVLNSWQISYFTSVTQSKSIGNFLNLSSHHCVAIPVPCPPKHVLNPPTLLILSIFSLRAWSKPSSIVVWRLALPKKFYAIKFIKFTCVVL